MRAPKVAKKMTYPVSMGRAGLQMIEKFNVYDHVWGVCNMNRFCGKGDRQVSVGIHSLHCHDLALIWQPDNYALHLLALVHDIPEAYYNDSPSFIKPLMGPDYRVVTDEIDGIVFDQLGISPDDRIVLNADLRTIDHNALTIEASYSFEKFEPMHWPPCTLYEEDDILTGYTLDYSPTDAYNQIIHLLNQFGETNEVLSATLAHSLPRPKLSNRSYR